jgi:hypothetical protein
MRGRRRRNRLVLGLLAQQNMVLLNLFWTKYESRRSGQSPSNRFLSIRILTGFFHALSFSTLRCPLRLPGLTFLWNTTNYFKRVTDGSSIHLSSLGPPSDLRNIDIEASVRVKQSHWQDFRSDFRSPPHLCVDPSSSSSFKVSLHGEFAQVPSTSYRLKLWIISKDTAPLRAKFLRRRRN